MPRTARKQAESNIYHIMQRGLDQQQLFYDDEDRLAFLERLARVKRDGGFELLCYCLMSNHVHLLVMDGGVGI